VRTTVMTRDDFSAPVREHLAKRVAYHCSAPWCHAITVGPSETRPSRTSMTGVAAHITAAAKGGPRYDKTLSPGERAAESNGIWLCAGHGRLVDNDTVRFTVELLRQWKERAELRASRELERAGVSYYCERALFSSQRELGTEDFTALQEEIQEFLLDIGVDDAWGPESSTHVRRLLYELGRNALEHGGGTSLCVTSELSSLTLEDNGAHFLLEDLRLSENGRGGKHAVQVFIDQLSGQLEVVHQEIKLGNRWSVIDVLTEVDTLPCGLRLTSDISPEVLEQLDGCETIHLYAQGLMAYSDVWRILGSSLSVMKGKKIVLHLVELRGSDDALAQFVHEHYPEVIVR